VFQQIKYTSLFQFINALLEELTGGLVLLSGKSELILDFGEEFRVFKKVVSGQRPVSLAVVKEQLVVIANDEVVDLLFHSVQTVLVEHRIVKCVVLVDPPLVLVSWLHELWR
jgi:hypothetical protein